MGRSKFEKSEKQILLVSPPGSGKGTQSPIIKNEYCLCHLVTSDMLRAAIAAKTPLRLKAKEAMDKGELIFDDLVVGIIDEAMKKPSCQKGFIFDGFLMTIVQTPNHRNSFSLKMGESGNTVGGWSSDSAFFGYSLNESDVGHKIEESFVPRHFPLELDLDDLSLIRAQFRISIEYELKLSRLSGQIYDPLPD
uniref:adenylate kinase n=1 Tax=Elaeis guineensis var. tenera TaxID=51953 RepID=A0A8N4EYS3_ELAGV|nr:adenylate kinase 4-like [Elaeis guineensis]